jgi:hypothetical protein
MPRPVPTAADLLDQVRDPVARRRLHGYLSTVAAGLPGSARSRHDILAEVSDGLLECYQAHRSDGQRPAVAAESAVAGFGDPHRLAAGFAGVLVGRAAHRVGLGLVLTGPAVGAAWVAAFAGRAGVDWLTQVATMPSVVPVLGVALVVAVPAALLAAAGTGPTAYRWPLRAVFRHLPLPPRTAASLALVATAGCVAADTGLLLGLFGWAVAGVAWTPLALLAGAVSLVRVTVVAMCARRVGTLWAATG